MPEMKLLRHFFIFFPVLSLLLPLLTEAQTIPIGMPVLTEAYRREQLLGKYDASFSFTSLPLFPVEAFKVQNSYDPDSSLTAARKTKFNGILTFGKNKGKLQLLPVIWQNQFNSQHPAGYNDGVMVPAKGYQTYISAGFYVKYGPLSVQLWPQILYVENKPF
ncbi:MAG TPA: hypothetical protein ENI76_00530, partial [Ignavibacteria bacterium]|nr:hypothetical protein [Ignavibacteria bacterium]